MMMEDIIVSCDSDEVDDTPSNMAYCHVKTEMEDSVPLVDSQVVDSSEDEEEDVRSEGTNNPEEDTNKTNKEPCSFCGQIPCDWETFGDIIFDECTELKDGGLDNNQVRYHAYRQYTRLRHGVLRRHDRRPLPVCVRGEIMDNWPDANHKYVGFQAALKEAAQED